MSLIDKPVFLVGSVRSGTTLMRLMLDHHPKIAFNLESMFILSQISNDGKYPEMARYREWLRNDRSFQHSHFHIDERLDFVELVNDFLNQKKLRDNKDIVGATIHYRYRLLQMIWPQAKYIYIYRDGRDVASSVMRMGWAGNPYVAADWWLRAETEWDEARANIDNRCWIEVRYEDLIRNSRTQLEQICSFLGVSYSEKMFEYANRSTYEAPDASLCYQWKTGLPKLAVQQLEAKLGERLLKRGYELSGYPRISVSSLEGKYLALQSKVRCYLFRSNRYGTMLTLQETLARRLGLKRLHLNLAKRIDRIIDANLK